MKHIKKEVKSDPADRIEIELGDSKDDAIFQPQLKYMRWDNEVNFSLRLTGVPAELATVEEIGETVVWRLPGLEIHWYGLPLSEEHPEGGLEYEVILHEKPPVNSLTFSIQGKGLDLFYQPPLTPEEIAEGAERPERVVGSYAAYHKTRAGDWSQLGGRNYRAGKAFHLYRPRVVDASGDMIWADLHIDEQAGILTTTIDKQWLKKAVYPVSTGTTNFGYETKGSSNQSTNKAYIWNCCFASGGSGTIDSITVYYYEFYVNDDTPAKLAIYKESDRSLIDTTEELNIPDGHDALQAFSATSGSSIEDTNYLLCSWCNPPANYLKIYYDTGTTDQAESVDKDYGSWASTLEDATTHYDRKFTIFCTYTAGAAGASIPIIMHHRKMMGVS